MQAGFLKRVVFIVEFDLVVIMDKGFNAEMGVQEFDQVLVAFGQRQVDILRSR